MADLLKNILVPTDFSTFADAAVTTAASLAKKLQAKLILLHVVDVPGYGSYQLKDDINGTSLEEIASNTAFESLKRLKMSPDLKGINLKTSIISGRVDKVILHESEKYQADLIVMGTHGLAGFNKILMGSSTSKVIRSSSIPVLSVKNPFNIWKVKNIAFASTFNQEYSLSFPKVFQFMEMLNAKLHLVKVITPADFEASAFTTKTIEDFASEFLMTHYQSHIVNAYSIEEGLNWFCEANGIDLIFMETHGRKGLRHLLYGSHTEKMGQRYAVPVFSLKMTKVKQPRGVIFPD